MKNRKAVCYPGCEEGLNGAEACTERVAVDGHITTSRGVGTAIPFALSLIEQLYGKEKSEEIRKSITPGRTSISAFLSSSGFKSRSAFTVIPWLPVTSRESPTAASRKFFS